MTDSPNGVPSCSRDPVITSRPTTAIVTAATNPGGPSGSRRHGPARATSPMAAAQASAMPYSHRAGCGSCHHGTRLARKVPAGSAMTSVPAVR